ncbi:MAG: signal peptide peptidase SppA, partial [Bacteroidaceae bacterium]|nr:signal peptide peptidase SppA [Bacteroidaceae bacterium]
MKQFLKYVCATIVGIFITGIIIVIMSIFGLVGIASMGNITPPVKDNSVLVIQLQGSIEERSTDNPFDGLFGNAALTVQGLDDILTAIRRAKTEPKVKGIYLEAGTFAGAMPATLQAIRKALVDFKQSGKFIIAYGDVYTQGAY